MKKKRIAGFVGVNNGIIKSCLSNLRFYSVKGTYGFCHLNNNWIEGSLASMRGNKAEQGFCLKNNHELHKNYWCVSKPKGDFSEDPMFVEKDKAFSELGEGFSGETIWKADRNTKIRDAALDPAANRYLFTDTREPKLLSSEKELLALIDAINSGDKGAASGYYRLTDSISLHGKRIDPIGKSKEYPFTGNFDGNGFEIRNFRLKGQNGAVAGFFGYLEGGTVANLTLDCIVDNRTADYGAAAFCGINKGKILNCHAITRLYLKYMGAGFVFQNEGEIRNCSVSGAAAFLLPFWMTPAVVAALVVLCGVLTIPPAVQLLTAPSQYTDVFKPIEEDPDIAIIDKEKPTSSSDSGSGGKASFEFNQSLTVSQEDQKGRLDIKNPSSGKMDFVVTIKISDAELIKTLGRTHRPLEEQQKLEADSSYLPEESFTTLYQSGRIPTGYELETVTLSTLADGTKLPKGTYELTVILDFYHNKTQEKAMINSQLPLKLIVK